MPPPNNPAPDIAGIADDALKPLIYLRDDFHERRRKARQDAAILLAQADTMDAAAVDLNLAIGKVRQHLLDKETTP